MSMYAVKVRGFFEGTVQVEATSEADACEKVDEAQDDGAVDVDELYDFEAINAVEYEEGP